MWWIYRCKDGGVLVKPCRDVLPRSRGLTLLATMTREGNPWVNDNKKPVLIGLSRAGILIDSTEFITVEG